jgi:hypothetical protein
MKTKAKLEILSALLSFPTISQKDWESDIFHSEVKKGDLVSINCASPSKWYLSWVIDINDNNCYPKYLLESIEDGESCWWDNIGINIYDREKVNRNPKWKWDDKQFGFNEKWNKVCYKINDAYIMLPELPIFNQDGSVILNVRIRFYLNNFNNPQVFKNWKNLSTKEIDLYYKESLKKYESTKVS